MLKLTKHHTTTADDFTSSKNSIATTSDEITDFTVALDDNDQGNDVLPSPSFDNDTTGMTGSKWESLNEIEKEEFWKTVAIEKERNEKVFDRWLCEEVFFF